MKNTSFPAMQDLGSGWHLIETGYAHPGHAAVYLLVDGKEAALFDAGIGTSTPLIMAALKDLGIGPADVRYLFISHAHLDHCAGSGHLSEQLPEAKVICHELTHPHLVDPGKLVQGARGLYSEDFDRLYGEVLAVRAEQLEIAKEGDRYALGSRSLEILHTPGHTFDHISILDGEGASIFAGDAFGVWTPEEFGYRPLARIPAAPTQFEPNLWRESVGKIANSGADRVLPTHYGPMPGTVAQRSGELLADIDAFIGFARETRGAEDPVAALREKVLGHWSELLGAAIDQELFAIDLLLSSRGLALWQQKHLDSFDGN